MFQKYHTDHIEDKHFLVTGGAGFIGSNLVEYLVQHNCGKIVILDNLSTGKLSNIQPFLQHKNVEFVKGDIRNIDTVNEVMKDTHIVLHQAALGSVPRSLVDPITTNEVNISGTLNVFYAAKEFKVDRVIYAASSSTYGDSEQLPKVEDKIGKPLSPYAITKFVNELYADIFHKAYGLNTIGLRYFNVFGRRQDPNGAYAAVIPKFVMQLMNNEAPIINGTGDYSRDFTYIDNVVQMNMLASTTQNSEALNQVYNVAFGERNTLKDLIQILKKELSAYDNNIASIQEIYGPNRAGDIPHSLASVDKAKKLLNYSPNYSFAEGIKKAVSWYWQNLR